LKPNLSGQSLRRDEHDTKFAANTAPGADSDTAIQPELAGGYTSPFMQSLASAAEAYETSDLDGDSRVLGLSDKQDRSLAEPMPDLADFYFYPAPEIDIDANETQMLALFERLASQWNALGEEEPFWSVLTQEKYKAANFDDQKRAEFFATGFKDASLIDLFCRRNKVAIKRGICLELGCGVGRVTQHLATIFDKIIAIDISKGNLAECKKMVETLGLSNVETQRLRSPNDLNDLPQFDFLYSIIVLQHNPPPVQKYVLDILFSKISDGGSFLIQAQTFAPSYTFSVHEYLDGPQGTMEMHSLPMHEIMKLARKHKLTICEVLPDNCTGQFGSHTFFGVKESSKISSTEDHFSIDYIQTPPVFDLNCNLRHDLRNLAAGLPIQSPSRIDEQSIQPMQQMTTPKQSLWGKLNSYFNSLLLLTPTRRKVAWLESQFEHGMKRERALINDALDDLQGNKDLIEAIENKYLDLKVSGKHQADELKELQRILRLERTTRQKSFADFDRLLAIYANRNQPASDAALSSLTKTKAPGLQSLLETFYCLLEERYRGSREEIKQRLTIYKKDFEALRARMQSSGPIIDLGCGRGEFVELLRDEGFQVIGIDENEIQLEAARHKGLPVLHCDAQTYLAGIEDESVLAVTGIHIVEHLPFPSLVALMQDIARVVKTGGLTIFETPNPRNLVVGAHTFHFDPTHIKPLPPEVLEILFETLGFVNIETRLMHPSDIFDDAIEQKRLDPYVATLLYGPRDYAVLGIKR